ncbi:MAG TPA: MFS transporter [Dehalococcoidia bacterium]|nr:MFS transporter [Dehalococcoidia bacterium]
MVAPPASEPAADGAEAPSIATPASLPLPRSLFGYPIYYGWYIVAIAFVASMMSSGVQAYTLGVFLKPMTEDLGWTRTDISVGQTVSTVVTGLLAIVVGPVIDRRGGRGLMVVGALIGGAGFIALGAVQDLWQYYAIRGGLITIGSVGMGALVVNVAVSNWFVRMRGRAVAIGAMGISVSALILPALSTSLMDAYGWRTAWVVIGVAVWVLVIPLAWFVMRRRPEDYGLYPDGELEPPDGAAQRVEQAGDDVWTRAQVLRTPTLWMLIATFGFSQMGLGAMLLHLIPYLTDIGFSPAEAARGFGMIGAAGLLSKPLWGLGLERFQTRWMAAAEFLLMALAIGLILSITSALMMYVAIFILGLGIGGVVTVQEVVWANYFGRLTLGTVRGVGRPFTIVSSAGGPVFAGAAYDIGGSYELAFTVFIGTYLVAAALIVLTPRPRSPATVDEYRG